MSDIQRIDSPAIPPTTLQISETLAKEMNYISGLSEEAMGMASDDVPGILAMIRMQSWLIPLKVYLISSTDHKRFLQNCIWI